MINLRCLYCGKELNKNEEKDRWHGKCIKTFFGVTEMPELDISDKVLEKLANENINKGMTVPGVQKKLSVHLSKDDKYRLTIVGYPNGYILKPQSDDYPALPEAEYLSMQMAESAGIKTVQNGLIMINNQYVYITKRLDRDIKFRNGKDDIIDLYAMEDFCQLSGRLTYDKYKGSYEKCAKIISRYSCQPGIDLTEFFMRLVFCFVTGNSDMHLKNFSLIEKKPKSREYILSPAYDLLPVNVIMPEDEEVALMLRGRKKKIHRKHFMILADKIEIPEKSAQRMLDKIISISDEFIELCDNSYMPKTMKENMKELMRRRVDAIS